MQRKLWVLKYEAHRKPEENHILQTLRGFALPLWEKCFRCKNCLGLQSTRLCFTSMRKVLPLQKRTVSYIRISAHHLCLGLQSTRLCFTSMSHSQKMMYLLEFSFNSPFKRETFTKYTDEKHLSVSINLPPSLWYLIIYIIFSIVIT